jgi:polygalacturonase
MRAITSALVFGLLAWTVGIVVAQPTTQFNVRNFGAAGDGIRPDTDAINKIIQAASDAGGGTVLVPAGTYLSGTIQLQNNVTLWIDAGATILGTRNLSDYHWPEGGPEWDGAIITAINGGRTPFHIAAPREKRAQSIILRNARMTFVGGVDEAETNGQVFSPYSML